MKPSRILNGIVHRLPADLAKALSDDSSFEELWNGLTPLGRNEFICWVENAKAIETRTRRIKRTLDELHEGKRRPCCWIGCVHRTDKSMSASQKWVLSKQK